MITCKGNENHKLTVWPIDFAILLFSGMAKLLRWSKRYLTEGRGCFGKHNAKRSSLFSRHIVKSPSSSSTISSCFKDIGKIQLLVATCVSRRTLKYLKFGLTLSREGNETRPRAIQCPRLIGNVTLESCTAWKPTSMEAWRYPEASLPEANSTKLYRI